MSENNKTKKCTECLAEIPKEAKKCSRCGSKQKTEYSAGQTLIVIGLIIFIVVIFSTMGGDSTSSTPSVTNYSDGYKLAVIDSQDVQYAKANESEYNRLLSTIRQNCTLDSGQKVSDMLVVSQDMILEETGREFKLLSIAQLAEEKLSTSEEKVRCDEFFAAISTVIRAGS